jgi:hypothetical protein
MQGVKYQFTVDALKVCFYISPENYKYLTNDTKEQRELIYKSPNHNGEMLIDFKLERVKNKLRAFKILVPDNVNEIPVLFAYLEIKANNDEDFANQCYITIDNRRFYEPISYYMGTKYNSVNYIIEIASRLRLENIISISNLEIAFDSNINFARLIKRTIADSYYIPVLNKTPYPNADSRDTINNAHLNYSTTRKRAKNLSFYIKQKKGDLQLKCYNKSNEIKDNDNKKTYIYKWIGMSKNIHRMEITAKSLPIKQYCAKENYTLLEFLINLNTSDFLIEPFYLWLNRLIHFKIDGKRKGTISVFDFVTTNRGNNRGITSTPERAKKSNI